MWLFLSIWGQFRAVLASVTGVSLKHTFTLASNQSLSRSFIQSTHSITHFPNNFFTYSTCHSMNGLHTHSLNHLGMYLKITKQTIQSNKQSLSQPMVPTKSQLLLQTVVLSPTSFSHVSTCSTKLDTVNTYFPVSHNHWLQSCFIQSLKHSHFAPLPNHSLTIASTPYTQPLLHSSTHSPMHSSIYWTQSCNH